MEQCEPMLHTLASFHADWLDDPRLGISVGRCLDANAIDQLLQRFGNHFKTFIDRLDDR